MKARKDIKVLSDRFWNAYHALRQEWLKTGGGMEMQIQIRDESAEKEFQRRSKAAKKRLAKRRNRHA